MSGSRLCIVSIVEGRSFPLIREDYQTLEFRCRVLGKTISTDPVKISIAPQIHQELAWPIHDKQLRIQRNTIRLDCYLKTNSDETHIGYFIVDIKPCQNTLRKVSKWHRMISSTHNHFKCELSVMVYYENSKIDQKKQESSYTNSFTNSKITNENLLSSDHLMQKKFFDVEIKDLYVDLMSIDIGVESKLDLEIIFDSKSQKFAGTLTDKNLYYFNDCNLNIDGTNISDLKKWLEKRPIELMIWSGHKIVGKSILNLNLYLPRDDSFKLEIGLPLKLCSYFSIPNAKTPTIFANVEFTPVENRSCKNFQSDIVENFSCSRPQSPIIDYDIDLHRELTLIIDLYQIRCLLSKYQGIFFSYSFQFDPSNHQNIKSGVIDEIEKDRVSIFPKSCCTFEFISSIRELFDFLKRKEFKVGIWSLDGHVQVLRGHFVADNEQKEGLRKQLKSSSYVYSLSKPTEPLFEVSFAIKLDIWNKNFDKNKIQPINNSEDFYVDNTKLDTINPEIVKMQEKLALKQKIEEELGKEWQKRETEYEKIINKKILQYNKLEKQLQDLITDVEEQKKELEAKDIKVLVAYYFRIDSLETLDQQ
ncbi:MAG: hypothetical protein MHPSP_001817 [Paramarteilia canceri]